MACSQVLERIGELGLTSLFSRSKEGIFGLVLCTRMEAKEPEQELWGGEINLPTDRVSDWRVYEADILGDTHGVNNVDPINKN